MDKKRILLEDISKENPFTTPEGYFENFASGIMSQLPDVVREDSQPISLWQKVRPWVYMAAMFAGIALMLKVFVNSPSQTGTKSYASEGLNLTSSADIEDFYRFYEDGLAQLAYDDAFYLTDFTDETDPE
jgi:hypothetical protein